MQESFAPVYPDRGDEWIDEHTPLQPVHYNRTMLDAERSVDRFNASGRTGIVLRFATFYGPDSYSMHDMADTVRRGWSPIPGQPSAFFSSISHDDAATAVVASLAVPAGVYNISDDEPVRRREYVDVIARTLQRCVPPLHAAVDRKVHGFDRRPVFTLRTNVESQTSRCRSKLDSRIPERSRGAACGASMKLRWFAPTMLTLTERIHDDSRNPIERV